MYTTLNRPLFFTLFFPIITLLIALLATPALSETQYISDQLIVKIRDNIESPYAIIGTVRSNEQVETLDKSGRFIKIRTADGKEGWIAKQYLKTSIPKTVTINIQKNEIQQLKEQISQLELTIDPEKESVRISQLDGKIDTLTRMNNELEIQKKLFQGKLAAIEKKAHSKKNDPVQKELNVLKAQYTNLINNSANVLTITEERDKLLEITENDKIELIRLKTENENLKTSALIRWFLAGASVFFFGLLFGRLGSKKRNRFSY